MKKTHLFALSILCAMFVLSSCEKTVQDQVAEIKKAFPHSTIYQMGPDEDIKFIVSQDDKWKIIEMGEADMKSILIREELKVIQIVGVAGLADTIK